MPTGVDSFWWAILGLEELRYLADSVGMFALQQEQRQAHSLKRDATMLSRAGFDRDQVRWVSGS
jgi:hypothetical protein